MKKTIICKVALIVCTFLAMIMAFGFIYYIARFRFLFGDDVLLPITNGLEAYMDATRDSFECEYPASSFGDVLNITLLFYKCWGGRLISYIIVSVLPLIGQNVAAILTGLIFVCLILLTIYTIVPEKKGVLEHPAIFVLLFLELIYFYKQIGYMFMWTMVGNYVVPLLLLLIYYNLFVKYMFLNKDTNISVIKLVIYNVFGLLAGATHEVILAVFVIIMSVCLLLNWNNKKYSFLKTVLLNVGLIMGGCVCFFSPGNKARMVESHDNEKYVRPFLVKIIESFENHKYVFNYKLNILFVFSVVAMLFVVLARKEERKAMLNTMIPFLVGGVCSVFIWGFGSSIPSYGLFYFLLIELIFIFTPLCYSLDYMKNKCEVPLIVADFFFVVVVSFSLISNNTSWMKDLYKTRKIWDEQIAVAEPGSTIVVPAFPESCSNRFTLYNMINNEVSMVYYDRTYGCHIVTK